MGERDRDAPILIAGGGMGGLATAIALAQKGFSSHVLERSETFSEAGAGIQLGPNLMRALAALDVARHVAQELVQPHAIVIFDGSTGRALTTMSLGAEAERRYGAPYGVLHRADLQAGLLAAARARPEITITTGFELSRYATDADGATAYSTQDARARGSMLIGADGISSRIRAQLDPAAHLQFFGRTAWRTLVDRELAPELMSDAHVCLWMAPEAHLVHYPVRGGRQINMVAVIEDEWDKEGWNTAADPADLLPHFQAWCPPAREILDAGRDWRKWSLFELPALPQWSADRVVLLGDAAHPVLPFLAQGAALAIEDARALARAIAQADGDPASAFSAYEQARRRRVARVQNTSRRMGAVYHYRGVMRRLRDLALSAIGPERQLARFDWLYRFDGTEP